MWVVYNPDTLEQVEVFFSKKRACSKYLCSETYTKWARTYGLVKITAPFSFDEWKTFRLLKRNDYD